MGPEYVPALVVLNMNGESGGRGQWEGACNVSPGKLHRMYVKVAIAAAPAQPLGPRQTIP